MIINKKNTIRPEFSNKEIAFLLRCIAASYIIKKANRFKIIAYQRAADTVEHLTEEIYDVWQDGRLSEQVNIGAAISQHLDELFRTGQSTHFQQVQARIPPPVFTLMRIPTIGPKTAYKLVTKLKLNNQKTAIADLKRACLQGKVASIPGFGEKSASEIVAAIDLIQNKTGIKPRLILPKAYVTANKIKQYLLKNPLIASVDFLGSLRRWVATIGDIDIAVKLKTDNKPNSALYRQIINYFTTYPQVVKINNAGEKKAQIIVYPDIQIDLRVQEEDSYGTMLQYFTGSKTHNIKLREYAIKKGYSLSEYSLKKTIGNKLRIIKFSNEQDLYRYLGLQYIPPELREGTNEINKAEINSLPNLIEVNDLKGDLHIHSNYNLYPAHDLGANSYLEIAQAGFKMNYQYCGFADHNPQISDLSLDQIINIMRKRKEQIDKIFSLKKIDRSDYFIGLEVDINPQGKVNFPREAVKFVDYLIVAIHSSFNQPKEIITKRLLSALNFPKVKILAHPTGRLLNQREGIDADWNVVMRACKNKDIALEINAWPERLDLPDSLVRTAIDNKAKLIINSDAHSISQMKNIIYGVAVARRGWAQKNDIINTLSYNKFARWIRNN